jgi:hypothetical protein
MKAELEFIDCPSCNEAVSVSEKAGSSFIITKGSYLHSVRSWFLRMNKTGEWGELWKQIYYWFGRAISPKERIETIKKILKLG